MSRVIGKNEKDFINSMVEKDFNNCWNWRQINARGFPQGSVYYWIKKNNCSTPRQLVYKIYIDENFNPDKKSKITNKCSNRKCVNPDHLYLYSKKLPKVFSCVSEEKKKLINNLYSSNKFTLRQICNITDISRQKVILILGKNYKKGKHSGIKTTYNDVAEIKYLRNKGYKLKDIAEQFKIDISTVSLIVRNKRRS